MRPLLLGLVVAGLVLGQTEPDIADVFYRLDGDKLVSLERQQSAVKSGAHGFVVMTMKSASVFPGGKSPVRFKSGEPLNFIVRSIIPIGSMDPGTIYFLKRLDEKKKTRELVMMSGYVAPFTMSTSRTPSAGVLQVEFTKYGDHSLKATSAGLPPGEYALGKPYGQAVFCFGVD